jgi:hypothetical protein
VEPAPVALDPLELGEVPMLPLLEAELLFSVPETRI